MAKLRKMARESFEDTAKKADPAFFERMRADGELTKKLRAAIDLAANYLDDGAPHSAKDILQRAVKDSDD